MAKNYNHTENMLETMESIIKKVRPLTPNIHEYEKAVKNEITMKKGVYSRAEMSPDSIIHRYCIQPCNLIMYSRMGKRDKEWVLELMDIMVEYAITGGYLAALSDNGVAWDNKVSDEAKKRIEEYNKRWGNVIK
jgi:hypothetical protein